jgi:formyl-CoA transferase
VDSPKEVLKSPQLAARKFFVEIKLDGGGPVISLPGPPYKFSTYSLPLPKSAPLLGEHTRQILEKLGVAQRRIEELAKMKVI